MSEWSTSLYYSTGDFIPDSDDEDEHVAQAPLQQKPAPKAAAADVEEVPFTETPFTIAARNAQMRRARQPLEPVDTNTPTSAIGLRRATAHAPQPAQDVNEDVTDLAPREHYEPFQAPVETPTTTLAPRHEIRHPSKHPKPPSLPSEVIVISSDTESDEPLSTKGVYGSTDTEARRTQPERPQTASERALQQFFDQNHDFYEGLEREMAQRQAQRATSEASSSARMESMVPDASTSYETSSWAPTRTNYSHETAFPVARLQTARSSTPMRSRQGYYEPSPTSAHANAQVVFDAYGNPLQPVYVAPPDYVLAPVTTEGSGAAWHPNDAHPTAAYEPDYRRPESRRLTMAQSQNYPSPRHQHQQSWYGAASSPSQHSGSERAHRASYTLPKTQRQALEDKAKADMVYKSLQGASKRARTRSSDQAGPSSLTSHAKRKENEWSTLEASRAKPDGTLSLTASLRPPLPATRLPHGSRGGSHLALPLYRPLGSSAEERRRAGTTVSDTASRQQQRVEGSSSSNAQRQHGTSRPLKLFRPSALTKSGPRR